MATVELPLVREVTDFVVCRDGAGKERWFDRRKYRVSIDGGVVFVEMDDRAHRQFLTRLQQVSEAEPKPDTKARRCLTCKKTFAAEKNIYVCSGCKETDAWKDGFWCGVV